MSGDVRAPCGGVVAGAMEAGAAAQRTEVTCLYGVYGSTEVTCLYGVLHRTCLMVGATDQSVWSLTCLHGVLVVLSLRACTAYCTAEKKPAPTAESSPANVFKSEERERTL